jgi:DNA-binding IclR family transcriptional regulator
MNYSALRTLRALEVLVFHPCSASSLAAALQIDARTARRLLAALVSEGYVERLADDSPAARYRPTVRLLAMAAQLGIRHPLVAVGARVVERLHRRTGLAAYVVVPSYGDVLVIASAGDGPQTGRLMPASTSAAGQALLAHREAWRRSQPAAATLEGCAADRRSRGFEVHTKDGRTTIATASRPDSPITAVAVTGAALTASAISMLAPPLAAARRELATAERATGE